jgi:geranylgeranyl diphosphate synthase, type I
VGAFSPSVAELRDAVEKEIDSFLEARRRAVPEATELIDEIARLVRAGGKRLRPSFCYWGYRATGATHGQEIVVASGALELLHTFAIVHDDIMDESDERRGEPTVHVRHGVEFALLVGDLALVLADAMLLGAGFAAGVSNAAFSDYSLMRQEVIAGQYLDVLSARRIDVSEADARRIAVLKSGRYSIEKPLVIGSRLGGGTDDLAAGLSSFGDPLGEAFQLRDDLLGTFGERESIGKPVDSDIREGKRNVLFAATARVLEGEERDFFLARWGGRDDLSGDDVARLRSLVGSSGALQVVERLIEERAASARVALDSLPLAPDVRAALGELARSATHRDF